MFFKAKTNIKAITRIKIRIKQGTKLKMRIKFKQK